MPGPKYLPNIEYQKKKSQNWSFSRGSARKVFHERHETPGPGIYENFLKNTYLDQP